MISAYTLAVIAPNGIAIASTPTIGSRPRIITRNSPHTASWTPRGIPNAIRTPHQAVALRIRTGHRSCGLVRQKASLSSGAPSSPMSTAATVPSSAKANVVNAASAVSSRNCRSVSGLSAAAQNLRSSGQPAVLNVCSRPMPDCHTETTTAIAMAIAQARPPVIGAREGRTVSAISRSGRALPRSGR